MINVGSDFSGVGAFNQALDRLNINYKTIFACDWDKYARQTYIHNYGKPDYYPSDVYDRKIPKQSLDIYMTSPPCQAFSLAGKRKGEKDKRGILFYNSQEFIVKNKPRYFIFENVKGLLSDDSGKTFNRWLDYLGGKSVNGNPVIFPLGDATPYHIYHKVLNAKNYGVPQNRERVFIVGIRDDSDNNFNWPKAIPLVKRLKDVLEDDVDEKYYLSDKMINKLINSNFNQEKSRLQEKDISDCLLSRDYKDLKCIKVVKHERTNQAKIKRSKSLKESGKDIGSFAERQMIAVDQNYSDTILANANPKKEGLIMIGAIRGRNPENPLSREVGLSTEQRLELNINGTSNALTTVQKDNVVVMKNYIQWDASGKGYNSQQDRAYYQDGLMGTVPANGDGSKSQVLLHNQTIRRLTPRECFRLMDFPDTFTWPVSNSQAYKQAGNSIVRAVLANTIEKLNGIT